MVTEISSVEEPGIVAGLDRRLRDRLLWKVVFEFGAIHLQQCALRIRRWLDLKVVVGVLRGDPPPRRSLDQPGLQQEGLVGVFHGFGFLPYRDRQRGQTHRSAAGYQDRR